MNRRLVFKASSRQRCGISRAIASALSVSLLCLHNQRINGSFFDFEHFRKTRSHYKDALETVTLQMILLSLESCTPEDEDTATAVIKEGCIYQRRLINEFRYTMVNFYRKTVWTFGFESYHFCLKVLVGCHEAMTSIKYP
jgi:hypothetical protein